jgi:basic membrane lipoprotein Med (substrate-binding protein (PBP1-ABC) superfamily)
VLITDRELAWENDLETWAIQRGLEFTVSNSSGASAYLRKSQPYVTAVISAGEALDGDLQRAASEGIPVVMVDVPGVEPGPSLSIVGNVRHDQAGFLAGVMTGLASQTGWIGQVTATGGRDEQAYSVGFTQGLLLGCPKCQLISQIASEFAMDRFRANTVDVVFPFPGPATAGVADVLASGELPIVWIGENGPAPNTLLVGRVVFEEGFAVILALEELIATGEGQFWQPSIGTYSILPVDINADLLSPGRQRLLEEAYWAIVSGELDIGTEPDT